MAGIGDPSFSSGIECSLNGLSEVCSDCIFGLGMQELVRGRNVKAITRESFKDKLVRQCLERAKTERTRFLANARFQSMSEEAAVRQGLDGTQLASLVRTIVSSEMSNSRDTAMTCDDESPSQGYVDAEGLEHLSPDEYIDFMKALEDEVFQELRVQGI